MIPPTLWAVFSHRWLETKSAPADAEDWRQKGYLALSAQGKLTGYVVTPSAYSWIVDTPAHRRTRSP